mgnify:CR=1 FL=1
MLSSLSLSPFNLFIINFFTFSSLYFFLSKKLKQKQNMKIFFLYGWIFGFGYFVTNLYWISISLTFDQNFKFLIPFTIILIPTFLGIFYGLVSYFFIILKSKKPINSFLVFSLTFGVLEDTTLDIGFLLPSAVVSAMNAAGISTVMNVDVNHVTFSIQGLPSGLLTQCDQMNCQYPSSIDGCMLINGIPSQSGNFSVPVSMLINIQIPAITDPIFGTTLFPATPIDLPSFTVNQYDLFIADGALSVNESTLNSTIVMNDDLNLLTVQNIYPRNVNLYNSLGQLILSKMSVEIIDIGENILNSGVYFVKIYDDINSETHKFIIK